ncbi:inhibitor of growth proteins N-terminal histone-binding-domain-containing protein [Cunninghamella echinulata]|nr:inhibitor of growth proteins N-terminal histone-binding-domain-containing protein [Cunninghamella echinulata]
MSLSVGDIFEDYVESLTNLPSEIDQNMHELRSMDEDFQRHRETYAKHKRSYLKMLRSSTLSSPTTPSPTTPTSTVHMTTSRMQLEKDYKTAIQKQDQKIELAMRMYDLVSRHIERIDSQMVQNNITPTNDWMYQQKNNNNSIHHHSNNSSSIHLSSSNHTLSHSSSNTSITSNSRKSSQWDNWHSDGKN